MKSTQQRKRNQNKLLDPSHRRYVPWSPPCWFELHVHSLTIAVMPDPSSSSNPCIRVKKSKEKSTYTAGYRVESRVNKNKEGKLKETDGVWA